MPPEKKKLVSNTHQSSRRVVAYQKDHVADGRAVGDGWHSKVNVLWAEGLKFPKKMAQDEQLAQKLANEIENVETLQEPSIVSRHVACW